MILPDTPDMKTFRISIRGHPTDGYQADTKKKSAIYDIPRERERDEDKTKYDSRYWIVMRIRIPIGLTGGGSVSHFLTYPDP